MKQLVKGTKFEEFRSKNAKLAWVVNLRLAFAFEMSLVSQVTERTYNEQSYKILSRSRIIKYLGTKNGSFLISEVVS